MSSDKPLLYEILRECVYYSGCKCLNTKRVSDSPEERLRQRSQFINEVVQYYITQKALVNLREHLKEGAIQQAKLTAYCIGGINKCPKLQPITF
ncbi:hypothetical protein [Nostoc sp.]|uniref:hypothetical protein n=1 Tax=Nostoc sp. TaxID=1180 RepID=UPI002FFC0B9B